MKYFVEQKVLTLVRAVFKIYNEQDEIVYNVKSKIMIPRRLIIYDKEENEVLRIRKRYFRATPRYDVMIGKERQVRIIKKIRMFKKKFVLRSKNPDLDKIIIDGDIIGKGFEIARDNEVFATVNKKFFSIGDKYLIDIHDEQYALIYLGIAIAIDEMVHKGK